MEKTKQVVYCVFLVLFGKLGDVLIGKILRIFETYANMYKTHGKSWKRSFGKFAKSITFRKAWKYC